MLILPPGHHQTVARPRVARPRERWLIGAVVGLVLAGAVVLTISLLSTARVSRNGCIDVTAAAATGGSELYRCGAEARALCSAPLQPGGINTALLSALPAACRKAGLPTRP